MADPQRYKPPGVPIEAGTPGFNEHGVPLSGWIMATDVHDARRQADSLGEHALARWLYGMEWPRPGRHELSSGFVGEARYIMLVS